MANQHNSSTLVTLPGKRRSKICFGKSRTHRHRGCTPTNKKDTAMHGCCSALKYCCSCHRRPSECEDPAKMTHSRMAFASRDLCCSVPKVSSDQFCLLASADSEGERGRTGVASVSERARASEGVCYFIIGEGCGSRKVGLPECGPLGFRVLRRWGAAPRPHTNFQRGYISGRPRTCNHT